MVFLREQLDDPDAAPCGRCDTCTGAAWDVELSTRARRRRARRTSATAIGDRAAPAVAGGVAGPAHGTIKADERVAAGPGPRVYGDGGWGNVVRDAKDSGATLPDELVEASVAPDPPSGSPTPLPHGSRPSRRRRRELRHRLRHAARRRTGSRVPPGRAPRRPVPPQARWTTARSSLRNVAGSVRDRRTRPARARPARRRPRRFRAGRSRSSGPLLRRAGSGAVHPFVLAKARGDVVPARPEASLASLLLTQRLLDADHHGVLVTGRAHA